MSAEPGKAVIRQKESDDRSEPRGDPKRRALFAGPASQRFARTAGPALRGASRGCAEVLRSRRPFPEQHFDHWGVSRLVANNPEKAGDGKPAPDIAFMFGDLGYPEWVNNTLTPDQNPSELLSKPRSPNFNLPSVQNTILARKLTTESMLCAGS